MGFGVIIRPEWKIKMRWMMKKILSIFLTLVFLTAFIGAALAEERIVQLTIPGCSS